MNFLIKTQWVKIKRPVKRPSMIPNDVFKYFKYIIIVVRPKTLQSYML